MVDFGMKVELLSFEAGDKTIFLIDKLIESFNFLCEYDDFIFEVFDLDLNVPILCKSLLQLQNFGFICLNLIVVVSNHIVESFDFFIKCLVLSLDFDIAGFLLFEAIALLLKFGYQKLEFLVVFNLRVKFLLKSPLVLLHVCILIDFSLKLGITIFPLFNLSESTFQDSIDSIVLYFQVAHFGLVTL